MRLISISPPIESEWRQETRKDWSGIVTIYRFVHSSGAWIENDTVSPTDDGLGKSLAFIYFLPEVLKQGHINLEWYGAKNDPGRMMDKSADLVPGLDVLAGKPKLTEPELGLLATGIRLWTRRIHSSAQQNSELECLHDYTR